MKQQTKNRVWYAWHNTVCRNTHWKMTPGNVPERLGTQPEWVSGELKTKLSEVDKQGSPFKVDVTSAWKLLTPQQRQELLANGWSVTQGRGNEVLIGLSQDVGPNRLRKKVQTKGGDLSERQEKGQEGDE